MGAAMDWLIWIGTGLSLTGVAGLLWCVNLALQARRKGLPEAEMRARLQQVVTYNLAALGVSAIGLMLVVTGILLG
jgi:hypothetical protein